MRIKTMPYLLICLLFLVSCQSYNNIFDVSAITSIKVEEWDSGEEITTITDESFIQNLVQDLEKAKSNTTANMDLPHPDYRLIFFNNDKIVQELSYYINEQDFGVKGHYHNPEKDEHYDLKTKLPIDNNAHSSQQ